MSLGQHLEELRRRLIYCALSCWGRPSSRAPCAVQIMAILVRPHVLAMAAFDQDVSLNFASYLEGFMAQMKACLIVALVVTSPFLIYQVWAFVAPGLFPHERSKVMKLFIPRCSVSPAAWSSATSSSSPRCCTTCWCWPARPCTRC